MSTRELLEELLAERILLLDGSMGALIYSRQPQEEDYRGERFRNHPAALKNCTEARTYLGLIKQKYPKSNVTKQADELDRTIKKDFKNKAKCSS